MGVGNPAISFRTTLRHFSSVLRLRSLRLRLAARIYKQGWFVSTVNNCDRYTHPLEALMIFRIFLSTHLMSADMRELIGTYCRRNESWERGNDDDDDDGVVPHVCPYYQSRQMFWISRSSPKLHVKSWEYLALPSYPWFSVLDQKKSFICEGKKKKSVTWLTCLVDFFVPL